MELPTRTLPHIYIAIIKIFAMSLCTVSFTAFYLFSFRRQASNAHVTPEETLQRHCEWWAAKQHATKADQCHRAGDWKHHPLLMSLGDLHCPEALQFWVREGRARPANMGPLVSIYFLVKEEEAKKWIWDYIYSSIFNSFISKGKEKKLFKKNSNTWTSPLYSRGRQEYPQCVT